MVNPCWFKAARQIESVYRHHFVASKSEEDNRKKPYICPSDWRHKPCDIKTLQMEANSVWEDAHYRYKRGNNNK